LLGPGVVAVTGSAVAAEISAAVRRPQVSAARAASGAARKRMAAASGSRREEGMAVLL
jgi:hypothetical protein